MHDLAASILRVAPAARRAPRETLHLRAMESEASDEELMLRYYDGDAAAFETLYRRHRTAMYRFLSRQAGDGAAADEIF